MQPICGAGLGSSLFKLAALEDARARGFVCDLLTSPEKVELLASSPVIRQLSSDPATLDLNGYDQRVCLGLEAPPVACDFVGDLRPRAEVKQAYNLRPHTAYWRDLLARSLGYPPPQEPARVLLPSSAEARESWRRQCPRPYAVLSVSALSSLKLYRRWHEVALQLRTARPDLHVVLVGQGNVGPLRADGVLDLTYKTPLSQLPAILGQARVVAGTDGLISNLGIALGRPTVALFSIIRPDFVIDPGLAEHTRVLPLVHGGCPLQFCYPRLTNYRHDPCPAEPELSPERSPLCMRFGVPTVVAAIIEALT